MSCECYMSRRVITSVILLVLFALLLNASLPKPQVLSTKEEQMAIASHAKVTPDEAALVQKDLTMHRRAADESAEGSSDDSTEDPLGYFTSDARDYLKDNPQMVNALKKLKPTAKEQEQIRQDQAELTDVVNNRGMEYAKPVMAKIQKHSQDKVMDVMKPSIAVAKAYKDLQTGLWDETKDFGRERFHHTTGVSMDDVDFVISDMEAKEEGGIDARHKMEAKGHAEALEAERAARRAEKQKAMEMYQKQMQEEAKKNAPKNVEVPEAPKKTEAMQLNAQKVTNKESMDEKDSSKEEDEDSGSIKLAASMSLPLVLLAMVPHFSQ